MLQFYSPPDVKTSKQIENIRWLTKCSWARTKRGKKHWGPLLLKRWKLSTAWTCVAFVHSTNAGNEWSLGRGRNTQPILKWSFKCSHLNPLAIKLSEQIGTEIVQMKNFLQVFVALHLALAWNKPHLSPLPAFFLNKQQKNLDIICLHEVLLVNNPSNFGSQGFHNKAWFSLQSNAGPFIHIYHMSFWIERKTAATF